MRRRAIHALATVAMLALPGASVAQMTVEDRLADGQPPVIAAFRGLVAGSPENSLVGIRNAIELGVDMVQVDVQNTRDGQYILMYRSSLSASTNVDDVFPDGSPLLAPGDAFAFSQTVSDYILEDIGKLRLLDPEGGDHPVPTLHAALDLAEGKLLMVLGLKSWETESLKRLLEPYDTGNLLLFAQGDMEKLAKTAEATGIGIFVTLASAPNALHHFEGALDLFGSRLKMVDVYSRQLTPELLSRAEEAGVVVGIFGTKKEDIWLAGGDPDPWLAALESGAGVFWTKQSDALLELLDR